MSMRVLYGGPPRVPPGGGEHMRRLRAELEADAELERADREQQKEFLRLAGVPDEMAAAALGEIATFKDRFSSFDLLKAIADLARQGAFVERRWGTRIARIEKRLGFVREAIEGKHDDDDA